MRVVTIRAGELAQENVTDSLAALQTIVDGWVEPFFTLPSPCGSGSITGYVNEEGFVIGLPINFGVVHSPDYIVPLAGNAVIVGLDDETGESRSLTLEEVNVIMRLWKETPICPIVEGDSTRTPVPFVPVRGVLRLNALRQLVS